MEVRLNKMISDSGFCSRREADKFIEEGRVSVNGELPAPGQKVNEHDIVILDDMQIKMNKHAGSGGGQTHFRKQVHDYTEAPAKSKAKTQPAAEPKKTAPAAEGAKKSAPKGQGGGSKELRPGKYVKYNKYAAARHASRKKEEGKSQDRFKDMPFEDDAIKEALRPKFGKSLGRSAVAQRLASASKSASLRKTSKNNPINKAKRNRFRNED